MMGSSLLLTGCGHRLPHVPIISPMMAPLAAPFQSPTPMTIFEESFARLDSARWHEIEVRGRTDYAVDVRYPDIPTSVEEQVGREAVALAERICEAIRSRLPYAP